MPAPSARVLPERSPAVNRDSFLHNAAQLTAEREAARPRIAALRGTVSHAQDEPVPPSWRNAGFVQELITAAADMLETDARESLCMAQLALAITTSLPHNSYPLPIQAQMEAFVWKEIGTAHRFLSEYDAALRAYDAALRSVRRTSVLAHDEAIIELARAVALSDLGRHDDALALIAQTAPVLHEFGDRFFVIARGSFEVSVDGRPEVRLGRGEYFGERALLHKHVRRICAGIESPPRNAPLEHAGLAPVAP